MKGWHLSALIFLCCWLGLVSQSHAALQYDPKLSWQTLETPHFLIHYHNGLKTIAENLVDDAENIHQRSIEFFNWTPKQKTHIVLTDRIDFANGLATPVPYNFMILFTTPPVDIDGLEDYDDWLRLVLQHEYVHLLHTDKAGGFPLDMRGVFGRTPLFLLFPLFPNMLQPDWSLEGLATYLETDRQKGIGRGQSSYFQALMRMETLHGIKSLREVNQPIISWPGGTTRYLYGVYFFQFVAERYGEQAIKALIDDYSQFPVPYLLNYSSRKVMGKNYYQLWQEFEQDLQNKLGAEIDHIKAQGVRSGEPLSNSGYRSGYSRVDNEANVFFILDDSESITQLVRLTAESGEINKITDIYGAGHFDYHPEAGILLAQLDVDANVNQFYDLYQVDPYSGEQHRLTTTGRYNTASWGPDGKRIIAVHHQAGQYSLHLLDQTGDKLETLWAGASLETTFGDIDWSPTQDQLVAAVWRKPFGWNIELFDITTREWRPIAATEALEAQPQFSADGNRIVYSADHDGIYNVYQLEIESGQQTQLTQVVGAALHPTLSDDGSQLYYSGLTKNGFNLHRIPTQQKQTKSIFEKAASTEKNVSNRRQASNRDNKTQSVATEEYNSSKYLALKHIRPRWWLPNYYEDNAQQVVSLITSGNDPLGWHEYNLSAGYDLRNQLPLASLQYIYDRLTPNLRFGFRRDYRFIQFTNGDNAYINNNDQFQAVALLPFFHKDYRQSLIAGVVYERESNRFRHPLLLPFKTSTDTFLGFGFNHNSSKQRSRSVSRNDGTRTNLRFETSSNKNGDYSGQAYIADGWYYSPVIRRMVFSARLLLGVEDSSMKPFEFGSVSPFARNVSALGNRRYTLRGYPSGLSQFTGNAINLTTLEWSFPLLLIESGIMLPPVGLNRVHGKLFFDAGRIWQWNDQPRAFSKSLGLELTTESILGFRAQFDLILGYAKGLDALGENQLYLTLKSPLL